MRKRTWFVVTAALALTAAFLLGRWLTPVPVEAQQQPTRVAAVPGEKGGQDMFGGYEPVAGWPKPLSSVPGVGKWTWGAGQGVFAESPNRVFVLAARHAAGGRASEDGEDRAERRVPDRPPAVARRHVRQPAWSALQAGHGRSRATISTPGSRASITSGAGSSTSSTRRATTSRTGRSGTRCSAARIRCSRARTIRRRTSGSSTTIVTRYSASRNDGKKLLQTIGTPNVPGTDATHFYRPTFMAWPPNGDFYVADGYQNTRVVKFDSTGKFLMAWGERGENGKETRPGYFNNVHGVAVDPQTGRVFVNDRGNRRIQVFDANGKPLDSWSVGAAACGHPSGVHGRLADAVGVRSRLVEDDQVRPERQPAVHLGHVGQFPGGFWGVHGMHVDSEGNFYVAEVDNGGAQKFRPRAGANPAFLLTKPAAPATGTR